MLQPVPLEQQAPQIIKVDVKENDGEYTVRADIPGIEKDDINVEVDGNVISISAEVKREKEQKEGDRMVRSERYQGNMSRNFSLAHEVDEKAANAKYADGVLELTLLKKKNSARGKVSIQ